MGKYDVIDKVYFGELGRMADLISVAIFRGKIWVRAEELSILKGEYPSVRAQGGEMARDILCLCEKHRVKYGLEIETHHDYTMPKRILGYDAGEYEKACAQIRSVREANKELENFTERKSGMKETDSVYAVLNMVLYLGQGHFKGRCTMREMWEKIPDKYKVFLAEKQQNYAFTLLEADYVKPQEYQSDLRLFFEAMQARNDRQRVKELLEQDEYQNASRDLQNVIAVHLGNKRLTQKVVEEGEDMCKALRDLEKENRRIGKAEGKAEGEAIGEAKGKAIGEEQTAISHIKSLMETMKWSAIQAMDALKIEPAKRERYLEQLTH